MVLNEQIFVVLIAVHLVTIISFFVLKRIKLSEKLRSLQNHPANLGSTALQVGGLVIVAITMVAVISFFYFSKGINFHVQLVFCLPVILLFVTGLFDDYRPISAILRLAIQLAVATSITIFIFQLTEYTGLKVIISSMNYILPSIFMVLAIFWMINTTNFIDGMDLLLVANVIPGSILFALLHLHTNQDFNISVIFLVFLSSLGAFVWFNRPKASIYMGDAGAVCIGMLLGSCGIFILAKHGSIAGFIPYACILVDTTFTLLGIIISGKNPLKSHSGHAYQIAAKNGISENNIRALYFGVSIINTLLALICIYYNHAFFWQLMCGLTAFLLSSTLFFYLRKNTTTQLFNDGSDV